MHLLAFQCTATAPRENLLQYYCSKICNTLLHSFLYGHVWNNLLLEPVCIPASLASHLWCYCSGYANQSQCEFGWCYHNEVIVDIVRVVIGLPSKYPILYLHLVVVYPQSVERWVALPPLIPASSCSTEHILPITTNMAMEDFLGFPCFWGWRPAPSCPWPRFFQPWSSTDDSSSQNHRITDWLRLEGASPSQEGMPRAAWPGPCPGKLWRSPKGKTS